MNENIKQHLEGFLKNTQKDWNYILPTEFYEKYYSKETSNKYIVIDLRRRKEYNDFHIPHSINIFWLDLLEEENLKKIYKYQQEKRKIFLICYVGHTSSQAMVLLKLLGIKNVISIKFGYGLSPSFGVPVAGWIQYQYPLTKCNNSKKK